MKKCKAIKQNTMAYSVEERENILNDIFQSIESGNSLRKCLLAVKISSKTFFEWIDSYPEKAKQYTRACEARTHLKFESIEEDYSEPPKLDDCGKIDSAWVQLQRLKIDAKKWELSKLNPKKYGDRVDVTSDGEKLPQVTIFQLPDNGRK